MKKRSFNGLQCWEPMSPFCSRILFGQQWLRCKTCGCKEESSEEVKKETWLHSCMTHVPKAPSMSSLVIWGAQILPFPSMNCGSQAKHKKDSCNTLRLHVTAIHNCGEGNAAVWRRKIRKTKTAKRPRRFLGHWVGIWHALWFILTLLRLLLFFQQGVVPAQEQDARKKRTEALFKLQLRVEALKGLPQVATGCH